MLLAWVSYNYLHVDSYELDIIYTVLSDVFRLCILAKGTEKSDTTSKLFGVQC